MKSTDTFSNRFNLKELVWTIGYRLTAYIGNTNVQTVKEWLKSGLPENLEERMKAVFDVAKPIEQAESEYAAQAFLWGNLDAIPIPESPRYAAPQGREHSGCSHRAHGTSEEGISRKRRQQP
jgi:hypothetical protein